MALWGLFTVAVGTIDLACASTADDRWHHHVESRGGRRHLRRPPALPSLTLSWRSFWQTPAQTFPLPCKRYPKLWHGVVNQMLMMMAMVTMM